METLTKTYPAAGIIVKTTCKKCGKVFDGVTVKGGLFRDKTRWYALQRICKQCQGLVVKTGRCRPFCDGEFGDLVRIRATCAIAYNIPSQLVTPELIKAVLIKENLDRELYRQKTLPQPEYMI